MQTLLDDGNQHVGADRDPDLRLHSVLAGTQKCLDTQMLFDPFEKQLHLPALPVQVGDQFRFQTKVVGQKHDLLAGFVLDHHAAQSGWVVLAGIEHSKYANLIAQNVGGAAIHRIGVAPPELGIALGAGDKEALRFVDRIQPGEVQITPIQQIESPGLDGELVQHIDLDVAQGLAIGQLRKRHGQELVETGEVLDLVIAVMRGYTAAKGAHGKVRHELGKHELALVHSSPLREYAKDHEFDVRRSNRDQTKMQNSASKSLTYDVLM